MKRYRVNKLKLLRTILVLPILIASIILMCSRGEEETLSTSSPEIISEVVVEEVEIEEYAPPREDVAAIAQTLYGECRGVSSTMEKAAVAWCILNRLDAGYGETVLDVVSAEAQFVGYSPTNPVIEELELLAEDVLIRHYYEKEGELDVGRILPEDYLYFTGDGVSNKFRNSFDSTEYWDWSLENVYVDWDYTEISR